jgi:hypothetical protein
MKRISVIATVDWAQIILRCLVLTEGGFAVRAQAPNHHGLHKLLTIDAALHSISRTVKRFLPDVVISGVTGLIKTSLGAATTGCWFRQQRWFEMSANCAQRLRARDFHWSSSGTRAPAEALVDLARFIREKGQRPCFRQPTWRL